MKKKGIFAALAMMMITACGVCACSFNGAGDINGNMKYSKEDLNPKAFKAISVDVVADVYYTQNNGDQHEVRLDFSNIKDERLAQEMKEKVKVAYRDGGVEIGLAGRISGANNMNEGKRLKVYITSPDLVKIDLEGVGSFHSDAINTDRLDIDNEGVGAIYLKKLLANVVTIDNEGVGSVSITHMTGDKLDIDNEQVLEHLPEGAFITVSNHPFGALDGISLIKMVGEHRPDFKVMVNMVLNYIGAMRPNFINVDALASSDPKKRAVSMHGIADAMRHVKQGHPLGFFPAGAVSKLTWGMRIEDRQWQPSIMRIIAKMKVPVVPIYFHGHNSFIFTLLGMIDWRLRTLRLPAEVFRRHDQSIRVSIGDPIGPEELAAYPTPEALGEFLKQRTYSMRKWKKQQ